jgi:hypothetical protein
MSRERVDQAGLEHRPDPEAETEPDKNISYDEQESKQGSSKRNSAPNAERLQKKYQAALRNIPAPGRGCHPKLLGVANLGVNAGHDRQQIFDHIRASIPPGSRVVPDAEIMQAVDKALEDPAAKPPRTPKQISRIVRKLKSPETAQAVRQIIIDRGGTVEPNELSQRSPVLIDGSEPHMIPLLRTLYSPDNLIFIGRRTDPGVVGDSIRTAAEWIAFFQEKFEMVMRMPEATRGACYESLAEEFPHIMPNPLSGLQEKSKTGKKTFRGDACISDFRFAVGEFDVLSVDKQLSFWRGLGLPVCAAIHSGGKSVHAWLRVDGVKNAKDWERIVENGFFPMLGSVGADTSCKNESRLSRLPGMFRTEKNQWQRLLWLCPEGGAL